MRIRIIFGCGEATVYSVLFEQSDGVRDPEFYSNIEDAEENSRKNEFDKAMDRLGDVEYLQAFFIKYRTDLTAFDFAISVNNAVNYTSEDHEDLISKPEEIEVTLDVQELDRLFKPLVNDEESELPYELQKLKAKGSRHKS